MPARAHWQIVREELARWGDEGRTVCLWLRDDDAVADTANLRRLAAFCGSAGIRPLVAAIPGLAEEGLATCLADHPTVDVAVHGWRHINHEAAGRKSQEFPAHRAQSATLAELGLALSRSRALFGDRAVPIYVPPWNRIPAEVARLLPGLGFEGLSTFGRATLLDHAAPLRELNTHVDIIDWRGTRGGRAADWLAAALAHELSWARGQDGLAIGILTHHLVHDAAAWRFLDELVAETAHHTAVRWASASELLRGD